MNSSVRGLVPQKVGFLGYKNLHHTSFFVDDRRDYDFSHYPFSTSAEETIKSKHYYDCNLRKYGKEVRYYHAENGTFAVASLKKETNDSKKTLAFCGVGSHHQK